MFQHYIKIALRNLRNEWIFNLITVICLAVGISLFAILFFTRDRYYYNRLPETERTYNCIFRDSTDRDVFASLNAEKIYELFDAPGIQDFIFSSGGNQNHSNGFTNDLIGYSFDSADGYKYHVYSTTLRRAEAMVSPSYFRYKNLTLLYGDRYPSNPYEIIVSEYLLNKINFKGDIHSLEVMPILDSGTPVSETYRVVNVVKDDTWSAQDQVDIYMYIASVHPENDAVVIPNAVLSPDADVDAINRLLKQRSYHYSNMFDPQGKNVHPYLEFQNTYLKLGHDDVEDMLVFMLVLIVGMICFLKRLVMALDANRRATLLRYCIGASRGSISWMQMIEATIMLVLSLGLALYGSYIAIDLLNNSVDFTPVHRFYFESVARVELISFVGLMLITGIVIIIATRLNLKVITGKEALTRKERHIFRNALICIELAVAVFGLSISLIILAFAERRYNPMPRDEQKRTFCLDLKNNRKIIEEYVPVSQLLSDLRAIPQVEEMCCAESSGMFTCIANINDYSHSARTIDASPNYLSFFNIPYHDNGTSAEGNIIYLSKDIYDQLVAEGLYTDNVEIIIQGAFTGTGFSPEKRNTYRVAGVYENDYGTYKMVQQLAQGTVYIPNDNAERTCYLKFAQGTSQSQAKELVKGVLERYLPEYASISLKEPAKWGDDENKQYMFIFLGAAVICILLIILSISSSITADTARRRKEVALRKINGAKARDIANLFVKPYGIMVLIAWVIGYSAVVAFCHGGWLGERYITWIAPVVLVIIAVIVALSIFWKVRATMNTDPADVIKSE
jgi:hypothetical protein